jgi:hypothetical protein
MTKAEVCIGIKKEKETNIKETSVSHKTGEKNREN